MRAPRRTTATAIALALLGAGAAVAVRPFDVADTYCGRPLWDAARSAPCEGRMAAATLAAATLAVAGALVLLAAWRWRLPAVLAVVTLGLVAVGANRLLEPTDDRYCGSVLNRHLTSDPALDDECAALLAPRRAAGVAALVAAGASAATAAAVAVRRR